MKNVLKIRFRVFRLLFKPLVSASAMGLIVFAVYKVVAMLFFFIKSPYIVNMLSMVVSIFVGMITYFSCLLLIKGISSEDLEILPGRLKKIIPGLLLRKL